MVLDYLWQEQFTMTLKESRIYNILHELLTASQFLKKIMEILE